jgi:sugar/nucleoside kinase (ribokinase family)
MKLVDSATSQNIIKKIDLSNVLQIAGGSACNSMAILSQLKVNSKFIGNVANDEFGLQFSSSIANLGCQFFNIQDNSQPTAHSIILVSKEDGERTMLTYLGASSKIANLKINDNFFQDSAYFYIEGYLWDTETSINAIKSSINKAKYSRNKIIFSLSDSFCVDRHRQDFLDLINKDIDILFANQFEITSLLQIEEFKTELIAKFCSKFFDKIFIITLAGEGAMVFHENKYFKISSQKIINPVDSTGAGDSFCAGFIYGLIKGFNLEDSAKFGNFIAGKIINKIGARFTNEEIQELVSYLQYIKK